MKKILHIAWNDIRLEFSERYTLVFFLLLPVVFTVLIGLGLRGSSDDPDADPRFVVLIVDQDQSPLADRLGASLEASDVIRPVYRSEPEARRIFDEEQVSALLVIPAGFERALLDNHALELVLEELPGRNQNFAIEEAVKAAAGRVSSSLSIAHTSLATAESLGPFGEQSSRQAYFDQSLELAQDLLADPPAHVETRQGTVIGNRVPEGFEQASPGQVVTWTMITLVGAAEVFVNERLGGTLRRLLITPTRKIMILTGKVAARFSMGMVQMTLLILFGVLILNVNWGSSPAALALILASFALAAVGFGVLLGTFAKTRSQASGLTILFSMLFSALGGAWWPLEVTPPAYQAAVKVLPTTWAMIGFTDVILRGQQVPGILRESGILLLFALVFFLAGALRLRSVTE